MFIHVEQLRSPCSHRRNKKVFLIFPFLTKNKKKKSKESFKKPPVRAKKKSCVWPSVVFCCTRYAGCNMFDLLLIHRNECRRTRRTHPSCACRRKFSFFLRKRERKRERFFHHGEERGKNWGRRCISSANHHHPGASQHIPKRFV